MWWGGGSRRYKDGDGPKDLRVYSARDSGLNIVDIIYISCQVSMFGFDPSCQHCSVLVFY